MAKEQSRILQAVDRALAVQQLELSEERDRQMRAVRSQTASGSGDIDQTFSLDEKFRLVFVRCHYSGTAGTADLTLSLDSAGGSAFDVKLFTVTTAGVGKDVHLRIGGDDVGEPSAWTFSPGDQIRVQWTNPDPGNITWGLEVGLALAS